MDQKQINVVQTQTVERTLQRLGDIVGVVCIVPKLCCYEQLIAMDSAGSNGLPDGFFGSVSIPVSRRFSTEPRVHSPLSSVNVAVSCLDGLCNSVLLRFWVLPGAESDGRDLSAGVEFELSWHCRESCLC